MKKYFIIALLLTLMTSGMAQDRKWEHSVSAGLGQALEDFRDLGSVYSLKAGYGLNRQLAQQWSIQTGLAIRTTASYGYLYSYLDLPVALQYRSIDIDGTWLLGLGPVVSYCINNDEYDAISTLDEHLEGEKMYKDFVLGLQPSIAYRPGRHWQIGAEANINLTNIGRPLGQASNNYRVYSILITASYVF